MGARRIPFLGDLSRFYPVSQLAFQDGQVVLSRQPQLAQEGLKFRTFPGQLLEVMVGLFQALG